MDTFSCEGITLRIHSTYEGQIDKTRMSLDSTSASSSSRYVGLGSIRLIQWNGTEFQRIPLTSTMVDATPKDLQSLGYEGDKRTLSNLYDPSSAAVSIKDEAMWLVPDSVTGGIAGADGSVTGADTRSGVGHEVEPDAAAEVIFRAIEAGKRVAWVGREARLAWWVAHLAPRIYERMMIRRTLR